MSHYSPALQPHLMLARVEPLVQRLISLFPEAEGHADIALLYTGMSGVSAATALSLVMASKCPWIDAYLVYVRKEHEKSHGRAVEFLPNARLVNPHNWFFVDDLIATGDTKERVVWEAESWLLDAHSVHPDSVRDLLVGAPPRVPHVIRPEFIGKLYD